MRPDNRACNALRPVSITRNYTRYAEGAVLVTFGNTKVLCTASVDEAVPSWLRGRDGGWITAEYAMLPRSAQQRVNRDSVRRGRALEISRLIGRSLRAVTNLHALGERQIIIDCDVLQADGGTRTAAITGAYVALSDAIAKLSREGIVGGTVLTSQCAAVSVGIVNGQICLDLCYEEDVDAEVDFNVIMRADGGIVEIQGTAERRAFSRSQLDGMLDVAENGLKELFRIQREVLNGE